MPWLLSRHTRRDALLDFAINLRDAIRDKTTAARSVEDVNPRSSRATSRLRSETIACEAC
jgi:hypothetical protein